MKTLVPFINWVKNYWKFLLYIGFIYGCALITLGLTGYTYVDDAGRQIAGYTQFAADYARVGSEFASYIVQGSRHLTSLGIVPFILSGIILTAVSSVLLYVLAPKVTLLSASSAALIGLNPWFLECLSFNFDSPYMSLSLFFSVVPFLWWHTSLRSFFCVSLVSLFLMCNTYQASSGIYMLLVLTLVFKAQIAGGNIWESIKKSLLAALAFILAISSFRMETSFFEGKPSGALIVKIAPLHQLLPTILRNCKLYFHRIYSDSATIWILLSFLLVVLFVLATIQTAKSSFLPTVLYLTLYLVLGSILSFGVFLIFQEPIATLNARYVYGFGAFFTLIVLVTTAMESTFFLKKTIAISASLLLYYLFSFPFIYANALSDQQKAFELQSSVLAAQILEHATPETTTVYFNKLLKNSPVLLNTSRNYPILNKLVPNNELLYWPNLTLLKTLTQLPYTFVALPPQSPALPPSTLTTDTAYATFQSSEEKLYVLLK